MKADIDFCSEYIMYFLINKQHAQLDDKDISYLGRDLEVKKDNIVGKEILKIKENFGRPNTPQFLESINELDVEIGQYILKIKYSRPAVRVMHAEFYTGISLCEVNINKQYVEVYDTDISVLFKKIPNKNKEGNISES